MISFNFPLPKLFGNVDCFQITKNAFPIELLVKGLEMGFGFRYPNLTNATATSYRVPRLKPNTTYRITVWPKTSAGLGVDTFVDLTTAPSDVGKLAWKYFLNVSVYSDTSNHLYKFSPNLLLFSPSSTISWNIKSNVCYSSSGRAELCHLGCGSIQLYCHLRAKSHGNTGHGIFCSVQATGNHSLVGV